MTRRALQRLDQEFCLGKTDLDACLRQAVKEFAGPSGKRRRLMIYVGDGASESAPVLIPADQRLAYPWLAESGATLIVLETQQTKSKTDYLRSLVEASGGVWFDLAGDVRAAGSLARWLQRGLPSPERIVSVAVEGASADDLFYSSGWLPGEPLYIYGRIAESSPLPAATAGTPVDLPSRSIRLRLTIGRGKKTSSREWTFPLTGDSDDVFVGRLWAQRRLEQLRLLDQQQEEVRTRIIALSQEWSLLSPHTAFLVLESEQEYQQWGLDRRVRRRYWKPAEARTEAPLPQAWLERIRPSAEVRLSDQEFSDTMRKAREALSGKAFAEGAATFAAHCPLAAGNRQRRIQESASTSAGRRANR